jgi:uncharacterized membrane protein
MKLQYNILSIIFIGLGSLLSLLWVSSADGSTYFLRLLAIAVILYVPGYFTLLILRAKFESFWLTIAYSIGTSIFWTYLLGLFSSFVLPQFGIARPLDYFPFVYLQSALLCVLLLFAIARNIDDKITGLQYRTQISSFLGYIFTIGLSMTAVVGAHVLNVGGSPALSISWLIFVGLCYLVLSFTRNVMLVKARPFFVFLLALSLLWMLSSRSTGLVGWDVIQEFLVAQTTQLAGVWQLSDVKDAYNACLSITLLPTILGNISGVSIEFSYKYIFPLIFAHFPVLVYFFFKKITNFSLSFLAVLYIMAQPFFIQPMVALARQEIAFFFFALLLVTLFTSFSSSWVKRVLVGIFTVALVLSHYSTTYVSVVWFSAVFAASIALFGIGKIPVPQVVKGYRFYKNWFAQRKSVISWWFVLLLIVTTYLWYFAITKTAGNVTDTFSESLKNMSNLFNAEQQKSQEIQQAIPGSAPTNALRTSPEELFHFKRIAYKTIENLTPLQIQDISEQYPLIPLAENLVPSKINSQTAESLLRGLNYLKEAFKALVLVGALFVVIKSFTRSKIDPDFVLFSTIATGILVLMLIHPTLGIRYNISRIYLQLMVVVSLSLLIGIDMLLFWLKERWRHLVPAVLLTTLLFSLQGALTPILGGIPTLHFYNQGTDYEKFYMFPTELVAVDWLQANRNPQNTVYGDSFAGLRVRKAAGFFTNPTIIPEVFKNNALGYVYLSSTNTQLHRAQVNFESRFLRYVYPETYLNENKNLIYSNSRSSVYK